MINILHIKDSKPIFISVQPTLYCPEATALFAKMVVQPSTELKELINKTIIDLKESGIWDITDVFFKWDLHTEQASLLNWKNPNHSATNYGGVFTEKYGLTTQDAVSYVDLNFTPSTDAVHATLNNTAFSLDDLRGEHTRSYNFGALNKADTSALMFRTNESASTRPWLFINSKAQRVWNGVAGINLYYNERPNSTSIYIYRNPTTSMLGTNNSVSVVDQSLIVGGHRRVAGDVYIANIKTSTFWFGGCLTEQQREAWYNIINYWKATYF